MNYIVAVTGASGAVYAQRLLKALAQQGTEIQLIMTDSARLVIKHELGINLPKDVKECKKVVTKELLGDENYPFLHLHALDNLAASISSGSYPTNGMIIVPCSMGTLSRIAHGNSNNLIERAADVVIKERRPLIIAPRETPLSVIHLKNMLELSQAGAQIIPCMPAFYHQPQNMYDLVNFMAGKILDALGIEHSLYRRWQS